MQHVKKVISDNKNRGWDVKLYLFRYIFRVNLRIIFNNDTIKNCLMLIPRIAIFHWVRAFVRDHIFRVNLRIIFNNDTIKNCLMLIPGLLFFIGLEHLLGIKILRTIFICLCKIEWGSYQIMKAKVLGRGISDHLWSRQQCENSVILLFVIYKLQMNLKHFS
jgi:hypothetical protein